MKFCKTRSYFFLKRAHWSCKPYSKFMWIKLYHSFDCNCLLNKPHNTIRQTWSLITCTTLLSTTLRSTGRKTWENKGGPTLSQDSETERNFRCPSQYISVPPFIRDQTTNKLFFIEDSCSYDRTIHKVTEVLYETLQYFAIENIRNKIPLVNPWSLAGQLKLAQVFSESNSQAVIKYHKLLLQIPCYCPP